MAGPQTQTRKRYRKSTEKVKFNKTKYFQQPPPATERVLAELPGAACVAVPVSSPARLTIRLSQGPETRQTTYTG